MKVNRKRVLRVMREAGRWCDRVVCARASHERLGRRMEAAEPNQICQTDMMNI